MRQPITFIYGNLVFGKDASDAWALYRLTMTSYAGLTAARKRDLLAEVAGFAYTIGADFQLLRVTRAHGDAEYTSDLETAAAGDHVRNELLAGLVAAHRRRLGRLASTRPEAYIAVALRQPTSDNVLRRLLSAAGLGDPRALDRRHLAALADEESRIFARIGDFLDCERASTDDAQWLVRRAYCRGVGEPTIDPHWVPQALVLDEDDDDGCWRFEPLSTDILRLFDTPIEIQARALRVESEVGTSHQAMLALGALPETVTFPGPQAELLFAPLEALPFPVDAALTVEWIANDRAIALARRRLIDADHAFAEESDGHHGPTAHAAVRPAAARELEDYLTGSERPPLLRTAISFAVSAESETELEHRVERVRAQFAPIAVHRPAGSQLDLFIAHLPCQRSKVRDYDDVLLCEQVGAMVPTATHAVGSETGFYIGTTLSGSPQPVRFDLTEAPRTSRPPALLCSGTLGSGKTIAAQLLALQAFAAGSRVVSVDPKGDHRLHELADSSDIEVIELGVAQRHRGLLDPLRIAPVDTRADLAYSFLVDILPAPVPAPWQTEIRRAVDEVAAQAEPTSAAVIERLLAAEGHGFDAGRALEAHAAGGLLTLAFSPGAEESIHMASRPMTLLRIANLVMPLPGTPRSELTSDERIGQALLRLLATYALHLMGDDWTRHKVLVFDEAWMLLGDAAGRMLVQRINRLCRSQNATPILVTQALADVAEMENLLGAMLCFGVETEREAGAALELLRLDGDDPGLRSRIQGFRTGRCFLRDYDGRVGAIQIDPADDALLAALDTTPTVARS